jgi:hypothetical protein
MSLDRLPLLSLASLASLAGAVALAGCQSTSETSRERGVVQADGYALVRAQANGSNHHWDVDVALRAAPEGTYALLFSPTEPARIGAFVIAESDPALACPGARARASAPPPECVIADRGEVVGVARVGNGGAGNLRAVFDLGAGGWFTIVRVGGRAGAAAGASAVAQRPSFEVNIVSEAIARDEDAHRFTIEQRI